MAKSLIGIEDLSLAVNTATHVVRQEGSFQLPVTSKFLAKRTQDGNLAFPTSLPRGWKRQLKSKSRNAWQWIWSALEASLAGETSSAPSCAPMADDAPQLVYVIFETLYEHQHQIFCNQRFPG